MEITELREQLHKLINSYSKEKLLEIYSFFEEDYSSEFRAGLEDEYSDYETNKNVINRQMVDDAIEFLLHRENES